MLAVASRRGQLGLLLAAALGVFVWPAAASAYTPEQQQACSGDAFRLCSSDIPDIGRVTACMVRNKSQLSPACRAQFGPAPGEAAARRAGHPRKAVSAKPRKSKKPTRT